MTKELGRRRNYTGVLAAAMLLLGTANALAEDPAPVPVTDQQDGLGASPTPETATPVTLATDAPSSLPTPTVTTPKFDTPESATPTGLRAQLTDLATAAEETLTTYGQKIAPYSPVLTSLEFLSGTDASGQPKQAGLIGIGNGARLSIRAQVPVEIRRLVPVTESWTRSQASVTVQPTPSPYPALQLSTDPSGPQLVITGFNLSVSVSCCSEVKH